MQCGHRSQWRSLTSFVRSSAAKSAASIVTSGCDGSCYSKWCCAGACCVQGQHVVQRRQQVNTTVTSGHVRLRYPSKHVRLTLTGAPYECTYMYRTGIGPQRRHAPCGLAMRDHGSSTPGTRTCAAELSDPPSCVRAVLPRRAVLHCTVRACWRIGGKWSADAGSWDALRRDRPWTRRDRPWTRRDRPWTRRDRPWTRLSAI
jgi:hypothetical protein